MDLRRNQLVLLPPQLRRLSRLIRLDLSDNNLQGRLNALVFLPLEVLGLARAGPAIADLLPFDFGVRMTSLTDLDLAGNPMVEFPENLMPLPALRRLTLSDCNLESLCTLVLNSWPNLTYLNLARNRLTDVPVSVLFSVKILPFFLCSPTCVLFSTAIVCPAFQLRDAVSNWQSICGVPSGNRIFG
jgi:hypothetical protein